MLPPSLLKPPTHHPHLRIVTSPPHSPSPSTAHHFPTQTYNLSIHRQTDTTTDINTKIFASHSTRLTRPFTSRDDTVPPLQHSNTLPFPSTPSLLSPFLPPSFLTSTHKNSQPSPHKPPGPPQKQIPEFHSPTRFTTHPPPPAALTQPNST
ncbi:uncharacterized protein LY89DRAFT_133275 [Mollisia scopiformis]|uniref:Uncharacterized protein n=1 Tax=Mollisia scopiformis TaxID=149040 RepID=A0A194X252_MOLSC|nr:uncharacterized protein LY89DRAFT_133275 [Mollisia scopiformis]KUJ14248.1 hypothetical protein LY89DRAFT_133275 [Mollisia scopiformis]